MRRLPKKKSSFAEQDDADANRWMISYADFLTLLFAFFVVMYALSNINVKKYRAFADSAQAAFSKSDVNKPTKLSGEFNRTVAEVKTKDMIINTNPNIMPNAERLDMSIESTSFFPMGSATLTEDAKKVLTSLALKLKDKPVMVTVEGHTDNKPIINSNFKSNWELSATRAAAVTHFLSQAGFNSQRLSAVGYGEEFPIADNSSEEGRLKNRRVVIVVSPNQYRVKSYVSPVEQARSLLAKPTEAQQDTSIKN